MKPGCHLCDEAEAILESLRPRYAHTLRAHRHQHRTRTTPAVRRAHSRAGPRRARVPRPAESRHDRTGLAASHQRRQCYRRLRHKLSDGSPKRTRQRDPADGTPFSVEQLTWPLAPTASSIAMTPTTRTARSSAAAAVQAAFRHWLAALNLALGVFIAGALAAPILAALGWRSTADALYAAYHFTCHEWAFRSFFLSPSAQPACRLLAAAIARPRDRPVQLHRQPRASAGRWPSVNATWRSMCALLAAGLYYARRPPICAQPASSCTAS